MRTSCKNLLKLIYNHCQNNVNAFQISAKYDDGIITPSTILPDIRYLEDNGYITIPAPVLNGYAAVITKDGELLVESNFNSNNQIGGSASISFGNIGTITNSVIGSNVSELTFNVDNSFKDLRSIIQEKPLEDQELLQELFDLLKGLEEGNRPATKGFLSRFSDLVKKHTDLLVPIGTTLANIFLTGR